MGSRMSAAQRARLEQEQRQREQLLAKLWSQGADLQEIAQAMGVSLTTLSELASDRMFRLTLRRLCALGNMRSQMITSRYRVHAAAKLVALSSEAEGEVARKASVDLLKMGVPTGRQRAAKPKDHGLPTPASEDGQLVQNSVDETEEILEALRKLGEVRDE